MCHLYAGINERVNSMHDIVLSGWLEQNLTTVSCGFIPKEQAQRRKVHNFKTEFIHFLSVTPHKSLQFCNFK